MSALHLIGKNEKQAHVDQCARHVVYHDLAWFTEAHDYLEQYWKTQDIQRFFKDYREFLEEISYTVNWILLGNQTRPHIAPHLVVDNTRTDTKSE